MTARSRALGRARRRPDELPRLRVTGPPTPCARPSRSPRPRSPRSAPACWPPPSAPAAPVGVDTRGLAVALRSERHLRRDGRSPGNPFDPLSAFHRTADGWLRLHANYPWHRAAALRVLDCASRCAGRDRRPPRGRAGVGAARRGRGGRGGAHRAGLAGRRRATAAAGRAPAARTARPRPARRPRVLDLTRVIAGPVATRTLGRARRRRAAHRPAGPPGDPAPVLGHAARQAQRAARPRSRADAPASRCSPGPTSWSPDTGPGHSTGSDCARRRWPSGIPGWSSSPCAPGATAARGPARRGFDSLVQAACGIAVAEGTADSPGALPAQALDHVTGYLGRGGRAARAGPAATRRRHPSCPAVAGSAPRPGCSRLPRGEPDDVPDVEPGAVPGRTWTPPDGRLTVAATARHRSTATR